MSQFLWILYFHEVQRPTTSCALHKNPLNRLRESGKDLTSQFLSPLTESAYQLSTTVGDWVYLSTKLFFLEEGSGSRKFHSKYCRTQGTIRKLSSVSCQVEVSASMKNRNSHDKFRVRPVKTLSEDVSNRTSPPVVSLQFENGHKEYDVQKFSNNRQSREQLQFLLKWKGHSAQENFWKPKTNLQLRQKRLSP